MVQEGASQSSVVPAVRFDIGGGFRDSAPETEFRRAHHAETRGMARFAACAAILFHLLMLLADFWAVGHEPDFFGVAAFRIVCIGIGIGFILLVDRATDDRALFWLICCGEAALSVELLVHWLLVPQSGPLPVAVTITAVLGYYLMVPNFALGAVANATGLSLGFLLLAAGRLSMAEADIEVLAFAMLAANALGFLAMRRAKMARRRAHFMTRQLQQANAELDAMRDQAQRHEAYMKAALDALPAGFILVDASGALQLTNTRALALLNLTPVQAGRGAHFDDLLRHFVQRGDYGQQRVLNFAQFAQKLEVGGPGHARLRQVNTGRVLDFITGWLPDGSMVLVVSDISSESAAQRRLRDAVEAAGDGFAIFDANDRLVICSTRYAALYGLSVKEATGKGFDELGRIGRENGIVDPGLAVAGAGQNIALESVLAQTGRTERRTEIRTPEGDWYLVQERITPEGDLVVLRTNITARRRIEDELRLAKTGAEKALAELRVAQSSLITSEKMASLGSMVAGMSHEISTPLGNGVSAASLLAEALRKLRESFERGDLRRADMEEFLSASGQATRILESNLERASQLMRVLKQVSVDQTSDAKRSFDAGRYADEILLSLAPALRRMPHRVDLHCPAGLMLSHRPGAFGQIITNLVLNALQHAFTGRSAPGVVRISISPVSRERVMLEVADDGVGMTDEVIARIFEPFFTTRRNEGGTGLGLHIVYTLVTQVLGGSISVQSAPDLGSRFVVLFPHEGTDELPGSLLAGRLQSEKKNRWLRE